MGYSREIQKSFSHLTGFDLRHKLLHELVSRERGTKQQTMHFRRWINNLRQWEWAKCHAQCHVMQRKIPRDAARDTTWHVQSLVIGSLMRASCAHVTGRGPILAEMCVSRDSTEIPLRTKHLTTNTHHVKMRLKYCTLRVNLSLSNHLTFIQNRWGVSPFPLTLDKPSCTTTYSNKLGVKFDRWPGYRCLATG